MAVSAPNEASPACSPGRRVAAMIYDALILVAIWMVAAAIVVVATGKPVESGNSLFRLYLIVLAFLYFHASWSRAGQTLGMRAWRIWLEPGPRKFTVARSLQRFLAGLVSWLLLGLGFAWALTRSDRRAWSDLASGSRLVVRPGNGRREQSATQQQQSQESE